MYTYTHVHVHVHVRLKFCVTYMYIVHVHVSFMGEKVFPIGSYTCTCKYNIIHLFVFFAKQLNDHKRTINHNTTMHNYVLYTPCTL